MYPTPLLVPSRHHRRRVAAVQRGGGRPLRVLQHPQRPFRTGAGR
ncbi:unnamed protein product [Ectocarpus sp. 12 AP-2014]